MLTELDIDFIYIITVSGYYFLHVPSTNNHCNISSDFGVYILLNWRWHFFYETWEIRTHNIYELKTWVHELKSCSLKKCITNTMDKASLSGGLYCVCRKHQRYKFVHTCKNNILTLFSMHSWKLCGYFSIASENLVPSRCTRVLF